MESNIWQQEVGTCYSCRWPNSLSPGASKWTFTFTHFHFDSLPSRKNSDSGANGVPLEWRLSLCICYLGGRPAQSQELGFQGRILLPHPLGSPVTHTLSKGLNRVLGCPAPATSNDFLSVQLNECIRDFFVETRFVALLFIKNGGTAGCHPLLLISNS